MPKIVSATKWNVVFVTLFLSGVFQKVGNEEIHAKQLTILVRVVNGDGGSFNPLTQRMPR